MLKDCKKLTIKLLAKVSVLAGFSKFSDLSIFSNLSKFSRLSYQFSKFSQLFKKSLITF